VTQDSEPGETSGLSQVSVANNGVEDVLIVTLSEYPADYHGENPVCVEMGWMTYDPCSTITLSPTEGLAGSAVIVTAAGFYPYMPLTVEFAGQVIEPTSVVTDEDGEAAFSIVIPVAPDGVHQITVSDGTHTASAEFTVSCGGIDMDPFFTADKTEVAKGETVTFTNLAQCGKRPYIKAEWDFDNDGVFEMTLTGTEAEVMAAVTWSYSEAGVYDVRLQMTDSAPTTRYEVRHNYIQVVACCPDVETWSLPWGYTADPTAINLYLYPLGATQVTLADLTPPAELATVWYYGGSVVGWKWFRPGWPESTLATLDPGKYYIGIVSTATEWEIPQ
jgi:PKD repeat protein